MSETVLDSPVAPSRRLTVSALLAAIVGIAPRSRAQSLPAHEHMPMAAPSGFAADMDAAMARMDQAMAIAPEGRAERDFARMMIAHHQGAIDMALALQRWGAAHVAAGVPSSRMLRLAQEIVVTQQGEIAVMEQFLRDTAERD
jgi:uncharacterized protein (DUF305 family)